LYTAGYRLRKDEKSQVDIKVTGMISAKSLPEGASVYLDEELVTATNDSIPGVIPGKHLLEIKKMAELGDILLAIRTNGKGTQNMIKEMRKLKKRVIIYD